MKNIFLSVFAVLMYGSLFSQNLPIVYNSNEGKAVPVSQDSASLSILEFKVSCYRTDKINEINSEDIDKDNVYSEITMKKLLLLDRTFTYKEAIAPGNPTQRTMIRKPVVYNSVLDVEKYLRKKVKTKEFTKEQADKLFNIVLDIALNTYGTKTEKLEETISKTKNVDELLSFYTKGVRVIKEN